MKIFYQSKFIDRIIFLRLLKIQPILVKSEDHSPQSRRRLIWMNMPPTSLYVSKDLRNTKLQDCLIGKNREALSEKICTITTSSNSLRQGTFVYQLK